MMRYFLYIFISAVVGFSSGVFAEDEPYLKEQIVVFNNVVTLGDLFENTRKLRGVAVFQSPDYGEDGIISASRVQAAAYKHGLIWNNPGGIDKIIIRRPSRVLKLGDIKEILRPVIADRSGVRSSEDVTVTFSPGARDVHIDSRNKSPLVVMDLWYNQQGKSFRAVVGTEESTGNVPRATFIGRADETSFVVVPARVLEPGDEIKDGDLKKVRVPVDRIRTGTIKDTVDALGKTPKYRMAANQLLRKQDLEVPKIIKVNDFVDIHYKVPGMFLRAKGRALGNGAKGDTISVLNVQSKRKIEAIVLSPGIVKPAVTTTRIISQPRPQS